jgi:N-acetylmuramoyl-L-alanine amidase
MPETWIPEARRLLTPNRYPQGHRYVAPVELLILHYTAGRTAQAAADWLIKPEVKASAHLVVGHDGTTGPTGDLIQLAPLEDRTWHAGGASSSWRGGPVNSRSIGIEIVNVGPLTRVGAGYTDWTGRAYRGQVYTDPATGKAWEAYPEAQIARVLELVTFLVRLFPRLGLVDERPGELPRICGHQDVDPKRKIDPGPAFPMAQIVTLARAQALAARS